MNNPVKPLSSILIKPAGPDCNLRCRYCFYIEKEALFSDAPRHRMSEAVLEEMVRQVMRDGAEQVNFGWQGGEPTLMGLDFFKKAVEFQQRYGAPGQTVGNGLQTNGLLITEEWAEFLGQYHFLVGLSLDGSRELHDHYRLSRGGEPTWERVMKSARLMLQRKVAVNALCVLNDLTVRHPDELYNFFKSIGLRYMQFIPCVETDPHDPTVAAPFAIDPDRYGEFLCRLFDRWLGDFKNGIPTTSVRSFDALFHTYVGVPAPDCTLGRECGVYVVIEHNGDVYACDFFVEPEWRLGNVLEGSLIEMLNSPRQAEFGHRKADLPAECAECPWLGRCWGGCPKDRLRLPATAGSNPLCRAFKTFFEHAHPRLTHMAERWLAQQREQAELAQRRAQRGRTR